MQAHITVTMTGSVVFARECTVPQVVVSQAGSHGNPATIRAISPRIHLAGASRPQVALIAARSSFFSRVAPPRDRPCLQRAQIAQRVVYVRSQARYARRY